MKCTFKCTIQFHELAPPTCVHHLVQDFDPFNLVPLSMSMSLSLLVHFHPYIHIFALISPPLSSISIKDIPLEKGKTSLIDAKVALE